MGEILRRRDRERRQDADRSRRRYCERDILCRHVRYLQKYYRAVVILRRGGHTELRRAEPREAFKAILCQSAYYSWDPVSVDRMTELAARVVNGTEIFCMDCPPDRDSVLMLDDELRKER